MQSTVVLQAGGRGVLGRVPPETSDREISGDLPGKERKGNTGKMGEKEGKLKKGRLKIGKCKEEKLQK